MILEKQVLLIFDHPNLDDMVYTREEVEEIRYRDTYNGETTYKTRNSVEFSTYSDIRKKVESGLLIGEIVMDNVRVSPVFDLKNASHKITDISINDKCITGTVEILNTPMGKVLQNIHEKIPGSIAFRPRSILNDGKVIKVLGFDAVTTE